MDTMTLNSNAKNFVDRAAQRADKAIDATRQGAASALDSVADKVHSVRDRASPAVDRMTMPIDRLSARTQDAPLQSLLIAAAAGAVLMALLGLMRSGRGN
jgi:ElaB/YqjD/DUF883 family membrane-anchored ribosome-binding protein